jgi:hypothetical protein
MMMGMAMVMVNFLIRRSRLVTVTQAELQATQDSLAAARKDAARANERCDLFAITLDAMKSAKHSELRANTVIQRAGVGKWECDEALSDGPPPSRQSHTLWYLRCCCRDGVSDARRLSGQEDPIGGRAQWGHLELLPGR